VSAPPIQDGLFGFKLARRALEDGLTEGGPLPTAVSPPNSPSESISGSASPPSSPVESISGAAAAVESFSSVCAPRESICGRLEEAAEATPPCPPPVSPPPPPPPPLAPAAEMPEGGVRKAIGAEVGKEEEEEAARVSLARSCRKRRSRGGGGVGC